MLINLIVRDTLQVLMDLFLFQLFYITINDSLAFVLLSSRESKHAKLLILFLWRRLGCNDSTAL